MFLDHDDYYLENACELLYNSITQYDVDVVSGNFRKVNNGKTSKGWEIKSSDNKSNIFENIDEKSEVLNFSPSLWTKIFSKDFLDKNNIRFPTNQIGEDKIFYTLVLFAESKILFIDEVIHVYEPRSSDQQGTKSVTLEYSLDNLLTITDGFTYLNELYKIYAYKYRYIMLNSISYLINKVLIPTSLTFQEFEIFANKSYEYCLEYKQNDETTLFPNINKLIEDTTKSDYIDAYKEYKNLHNPLTSYSAYKNLISIIIDVYDKDLLEKGLNNLFNQTQNDIEIICIKYCFDDLSNTINNFKDKFYNIKLIKYDNKEYFFNRKIMEANGEYILLTTSYNLASKHYIENLKEILQKTFKDYYDIILFNPDKYKNDENEEILKLSNNVLNPNDLTSDKINILYNLNCDKLISSKLIFKTNDYKINELSCEPLTYLDLLIYAKKIYLHNFKQFENTLKTLKLRDDNILDKPINVTNKIEYLRDQPPLKVQENEVIKLSKDITENPHPKISIIIPAYNPKKKRVQRLIISIINQSFEFNDLEVIFIDDCSDYLEGINLIKEYCLEYPNIKLFKTSVNSGSGIAYNIGLDNAKGKYVMFLDCDDYYFSNACETLYNTIEQEDAMVVQGNFIKPDWSYSRLDWKSKGVPRYKTITKTIDEKENCLQLTSAVLHVIIRKEYLDYYNIRFKDYRIAQDTLFHDTCLLKDCKAIFINEPIKFYELHRSANNKFVPKTIERSLYNLYTRFKSREEICQLYDDYSPEYKHIILNDVNYLTNFLLNTPLNYHDFKEYVDETSAFYSEYLNNKKTKDYPKIKKLIGYLANEEYSNAYDEYINLRI